MDDNYRFDYFYGSQTEQFPFFRLPKAIIRDQRFKKLSSDAKILYSILLDRMTLSRENNWVDQENRVYIIFTLNEVMKEFECCKRKASMLMTELDGKSGVGLIEKKKQGLGKPDLIYLKNFTEPLEMIEEPAEQILLLQSGKNMQLQSSKDAHPQERKKMPPGRSKEMLPQSSINVPANNTEYNKTDSNENESIDPIDQQNDHGETDMVSLYRQLVKENIGYDTLYGNISIIRQQMLDEIVELMVEVLITNRKSLRIAGAEYPYLFVKSRFLCIGQDHVEYVLSCLEQTSSKIGNIKAYLLTSLFNSTATIDTYYATAVQHDLAEEIWG